jgi:hypothetical protein
VRASAFFVWSGRQKDPEAIRGVCLKKMGARGYMSYRS